jgi:hypothetical protein
MARACLDRLSTRRPGSILEPRVFPPQQPAELSARAVRSRRPELPRRTVSGHATTSCLDREATGPILTMRSGKSARFVMVRMEGMPRGENASLSLSAVNSQKGAAPAVAKRR